MNIKPLARVSSSTQAYFNSTTLTYMLAVGSLAVGIGAVAFTAPAQAIELTNSDLTFGSGVPTFFGDVNLVAGDTITVTFVNPTDVSSANGILKTNADFFPTTPGMFNFAPTPPVATFNYLSSFPLNATTTSFAYSLADPLNFNFANGVNLTIAKDTVFTGTRSATAVAFSTIDATGSFFENDGMTTALNALSFGFNDISGSGNGTYGITASTVAHSTTQVPEPFTIVGTIIGGTAALRMRKKLANTTK